MTKKNIVYQTALIIAAATLTACQTTIPAHKNLTLVDCAIQQSIPGSQTTGAFLNIIKNDKQTLALTAVSAPDVTDHVEIHEMSMVNGTMSMLKVNDFSLEKGNNHFVKGGFHIMLMNLEKTLTVGESYPLTFTFSDGGQQTCQADVKSIEALTPSRQAHSHNGGNPHHH